MSKTTLSPEWTRTQIETAKLLREAGLLVSNPVYVGMVKELKDKVDPAQWLGLVRSFIEGEKVDTKPAQVDAHLAKSGTQAIVTALDKATRSGASSEEIGALRAILSDKLAEGERVVDESILLAAHARKFAKKKAAVPDEDELEEADVT